MALSKFTKPELSNEEEQRKICIATMPIVRVYPKYVDIPDVSKRMTLKEKQNYIRNMDTNPKCPDVSKYKLVKKIGSGTFGDVFMAHEVAEPSNIVAIKKIKFVNEKPEGFPVTALREIDILKQLQHENIVKLIEVCRSSSLHGENITFTYCLILEYCEHDLGGILVNQMIDITDAEKKTFVQQLLVGVEYMHRKKVLHRDIKSANLLLSKQGYLKLADMGLARIINKPRDVSQGKVFTNCVVTLWYRAPELLLGAVSYGNSVDLWSVGLIISEIWLREPLLQGNTEMEQLSLILKLCGSITPISCPSAMKFPLFRRLSLPSTLKRKVITSLKSTVCDILCLELIDALLLLEPSKRLSATEALSHTYFHSPPYSTDLHELMKRIRGNYYSH